MDYTLLEVINIFLNIRFIFDLVQSTRAKDTHNQPEIYFYYGTARADMQCTPNISWVTIKIQPFRDVSWVSLQPGFFFYTGCYLVILIFYPLPYVCFDISHCL